MEKQKCAIPDCNNIAASRGKRGENSPVRDKDAHKRFKWCAYHRNGKGKGVRMQFQNRENKNV